MSDADEQLVARWKARRLSMYRKWTVDDQSQVHFVDGDFEVIVRSSTNGQPLLDEVSRFALEEYLNRHEQEVWQP